MCYPSLSYSSCGPPASAAVSPRPPQRFYSDIADTEVRAGEPAAGLTVTVIIQDQCCMLMMMKVLLPYPVSVVATDALQGAERRRFRNKANRNSKVLTLIRYNVKIV